MIPTGYEEYVQDGVRTRDIQLDHFAEVLAVVQMTRKYNQAQLAEKVMNGDTSSLHYYLVKERLPQQNTKRRLLKRMGELLQEEKRVNTLVHGRVYL